MGWIPHPWKDASSLAESILAEETLDAASELSGSDGRFPDQASGHPIYFIIIIIIIITMFIIMC